jgi:cardiolipin synthase
VRILTVANQLTFLRILIIPAFVLMVTYGYLGWALLAFITAGVTDALDGLIARRANQRTSLGAWLDPMADKLLLVTTFIVLTLPGVPVTNHIPLWLTILLISRDVVIVGVVAIVNLAVGPRTFRPSFLGKLAARDRHLYRDERGVHVLQLAGRTIAGGRCCRLRCADPDDRFERRLLRAHAAPDQRGPLTLLTAAQRRRPKNNT